MNEGGGFLTLTIHCDCEDFELDFSAHEVEVKGNLDGFLGYEIGVLRTDERVIIRKVEKPKTHRLRDGYTTEHFLEK